MKKSTVTVTHHGRKVQGFFYDPETKEYPVIIFSHGYNGHASDFDKSAGWLAERGIGAACFTFCGGSARDESGFSTTEMTLETEKEDLCALLDEILGWERVNRNQVFLFGASQGGMVSAMAAADRREEIRGLLLLYPAFCIPDDWNERFPEEQDIPGRLEFWGMELGGGFFRQLREMDIHRLFAGYEGPVLLMHGDKDSVVPDSYSRLAASEYASARLELFPGEGHGFSEEGSRRVDEMAEEFVRHSAGLSFFD